MPPEQNPQQPLGQQPQLKQVPDPKTERSPAIRTMKSDVEEFLKTTKPSLVQIIGQRAESLPTGPAKERRPMVIVLALAALAAILGGAAFMALGGTRLWSSAPPTEEPPAALRATVAPPPYFATETSRTISVSRQDRSQFVRLMEDSWREKEREGTIKRLIVKVQDGPQERFATPEDFFQLWRISPPTDLIRQLDPNLMVFIYYGSAGSRLGMAVRTREPERVFANLLSWEPSLIVSMAPLFFDSLPDALPGPFEDRAWRNIDWRYLKLSAEQDLGVGYAVFPVGQILVLTTSKEAMETVINRLFDAK